MIFALYCKVLDEENECPKCKEFQRQIKDLRERLDAADEPLKVYFVHLLNFHGSFIEVF